jgi:carbonic anhydrase
MATITCENATAPMNITKDKIQGPCTLLCDFNHNYGTYTPNVTNNSNFLSLNYTSPTLKPPVIYNDLGYNVSEIRIYQPSLHKYNGTHAIGEILIIQGGNGKNLITSIPITEGGKNDKGSSQLTTLLEEAAIRIGKENESMTFSGGAFSLDNFIPNRVPYFSYTGTLPYSPCNGKYAYVVFDLQHALNIPSHIVSKLQKIIKPTTVQSTIGNNYLFYNKDGANSRENNRDQIYIDCQPVNEEGELLVKESSGSNNDSDVNMEEIMEKLKPFLYILIGIVAAIGITKGASFLFKKMKKGTATTNS